MKKKLLVALMVIVLVLALFLTIHFLQNKKAKSESDISYKILDTSDYNSSYSKRGYYVEEAEDGKVKVTISMGTQNTGGYDLSIEKINIVNGGAQIHVKKTTPSEGEFVTEALTFPIVQVIFDKMPEYITVESLDDSQSFDKVSD